MSRFRGLRSDSPLFSMRVDTSIKASCCGVVALFHASRRPRTLCALRTRPQQISTSCSLVRHVFTLESSNKCASSKHISRELLFRNCRNCVFHKDGSSALFSLGTLKQCTSSQQTTATSTGPNFARMEDDHATKPRTFTF